MTSVLDGGVSFMHRPLYPQEKSPFYPLHRKMAEREREPVRTRGWRTKFLALPGLEPAIIQPAAQRYTAELCRLLWSVSYTSESTSLCTVLQPPAISSILVPNIHLSTLFLYSLHLCCFLNAVMQNLRPAKSKHLSMLIFSFLQHIWAQCNAI
jgi:hypothetical protein